MKRLTKRQEEVLSFIKEFLMEHMFTPTHEEIRLHFGFASPNAAYNHIAALSKKGVITTYKGRKGITLNNCKIEIIEI